MNNEQWGNIELPGLSDEKLLSKNWNIVANNQSTWKNQETKNRRIAGIKKAKAEDRISEELRLEIYQNSFGPNRRATNKTTEIGYTALMAEKYNLSESWVYHLINNSLGTVSDSQHKENMSKWEKQYGFGTWKITPPSAKLLKDYDAFFVNGCTKMPPSVVWHVRFNMKDAPISDIRDYLLPWTGGKYITSKGRIDNGAYLRIRNVLFKFLTDKTPESFYIDNPDEMAKFLCKFLNRKSISRTYMWQKLEQPIKSSGWKFERVCNE